MEDYYREVLGADARNIWKSNGRILYEYGKLNVWPNIKLSNVREKMQDGGIEEACTKLNEVKADLANFGKNYFSAAIYSSLETDHALRVGPYESYEFGFSDYMYRSFYTMNFMKMREKQLKGKAYEAKVIRKNLLDEEFFDGFRERTNCYRGEKRKEKPKRKRQKIKSILKNGASKFAETTKIIFPLQTLGFPLLYMMLTNKNNGCPYQTTRFYSEMIAEKTGKNGFDDEILSSKLYKDLFLPNFGIDRCTPQELKVFKDVKDDEKKFRKISTTWNSALVQIEK